MDSASIFVSIVLLMIIVGVNSTSEADKINRLPGQPKVKFHQYSGHITIDQAHQRALFYYFVEAEVHPASKPVVLWLNGGPGCSSVGQGAFTEHGPFKPTMKGRLVKNPFSWNREANIIYLDSPIGVGFSYSANKSDYYLVNDQITARDNLLFLQGWFSRFPMYQSNDFFITGESYAGHFAPQLAELILQTKASIRLKGIAIGNPLLEFNIDFSSGAEFLWSHGQIQDSTYQMLKTACSIADIKRQSRTGKLSNTCDKVNLQLSLEVTEYTNAMDVTLDICPTPGKQQAYVLTQQQAGEKIDVCVGDATFTYLNRKEVRKALHAQLVGNWSTCTSVMLYDFQNLENPTIAMLGTLVKSGVRVLAYSGDQDSVIPLTGTRTLVIELAKELGLNTTGAYRPWFEGGQVAGSTQVYGDILAFATIKGAGHAAPSSQPGRSLVLFKAFLEGKQLPEHR